MADPVLLAHLVAPNAFELGGLSPTSIRDQMVRGQMLVDRAVEVGLIGPATRPLLVVGAGVGGATAAVRAAEHSVDVLVIDEAPIPFFRQAACRTRWVDPTQYDWPAGHWPRGRFPWTPPPVPLPWAAGFGSVLAIAWTRAFNRHRRRLAPRLTFLPRTTLSGYPGYPPGAGRFVQVHLRHRGRVVGPLDVAMLLLTRSYGVENTTVGAYRGFGFWETDSFARPNLGLPAPDRPRVLISGAGDGALQDLLRVLTGGRSAREIFDRVVDPASPAWGSALAAVRDAEDQAQRAYSWGERKRHDHAVFVRLERAHHAVINDLANDPVAWTAINDALDDLVGAPPDVALVHACSHFASNYPLNRFLVLLIERWLDAARPGAVAFRRNERVVGVDGAGLHLGGCGDPTICHGEPHRVTTTGADCGGAFGNERTDEYLYNVVVVRHGATPTAAVLPPVSRPRQILPYHAP